MLLKEKPGPPSMRREGRPVVLNYTSLACVGVSRCEASVLRGVDKTLTPGGISQDTQRLSLAGISFSGDGLPSVMRRLTAALRFREEG